MYPSFIAAVMTSCLRLSQVVIYGDGTGVPLTLREWALLDYDHIWQQAVSYGVPHCVAETFPQLVQRVKESVPAAETLSNI